MISLNKVITIYNLEYMMTFMYKLQNIQYPFTTSSFIAEKSVKKERQEIGRGCTSSRYARTNQ